MNEPPIFEFQIIKNPSIFYLHLNPISKLGIYQERITFESQRGKETYGIEDIAKAQFQDKKGYIFLKNRKQIKFVVALNTYSLENVPENTRKAVEIINNVLKGESFPQKYIDEAKRFLLQTMQSSDRKKSRLGFFVIAFYLLLCIILIGVPTYFEYLDSKSLGDFTKGLIPFLAIPITLIIILVVLGLIRVPKLKREYEPLFLKYLGRPPKTSEILFGTWWSFFSREAREIFKKTKHLALKSEDEKIKEALDFFNETYMSFVTGMAPPIFGQKEPL